MADVELKGITKKYKNKEVLCGVDLQASKGTCIGILGRNGSGKSTLLEILAGILKPDAGSFRFMGKELLGKSGSLEGTVGYVPQGTPFYEELTAMDNLRLWYSKEEIARELDGGILKKLGIDGFLHLRVSKMSGGMKKRLSIGCALCAHPTLLLLDEPSSALDLPCKAEIRECFRTFAADGGTIFLVTHDMQEAEICSEIYVLTDGKLEKRDASAYPDLFAGSAVS